MNKSRGEVMKKQFHNVVCENPSGSEKQKVVSVNVVLGVGGVKTFICFKK